MQRSEQKLNNKSLHLEYERPVSNNRLYSAIVDLFIAVLIILLLVLTSNSIVKVTPFYAENNGVVNQYKLDSKLYTYDASGNITIVNNTLLIEDDQTASQILNKCIKVIEGDPFAPKEEDRQGFLFFCAVETVKNPAELKDFFKEHRDAYNKERLEALNPSTLKPLFTTAKDDDGEVKMIQGIKVFEYTNSDGSLTYKTKDEGNGKLVFDEGLIPSIIQTGNGKMIDYIDNFYKPFIRLCPNSLIKIPGYFAATQQLSTIMLSVLVPVPVVLGIFIVYFIPGLIFKRGRKSIGKLIFKIGVIDKTNLSPNVKRYLLRSLIIFFECILFIPAVISLTMMIFTKKGTTLHDYILKMNLVSTVGRKVYLDKVDALLGETKTENRHVEFENVQKLR